jgi:hypothetical protein
LDSLASECSRLWALTLSISCGDVEGVWLSWAEVVECVLSVIVEWSYDRYITS